MASNLALDPLVLFQVIKYIWTKKNPNSYLGIYVSSTSSIICWLLIKSLILDLQISWRWPELSKQKGYSGLTLPSAQSLLAPPCLPQKGSRIIYESSLGAVGVNRVFTFPFLRLHEWGCNFFLKLETKALGGGDLKDRRSYPSNRLKQQLIKQG